MNKPNTEWMRFYSKYIKKVFVADRIRNKILDNSLDIIQGYINLQLADAVKHSTHLTGETIDYSRLLTIIRGSFSRIETEVVKQYNRIAKVTDDNVKDNFMQYRQEANKTLDKLKVRKTTIKEAELSVVFHGTPTAAFKKQLSNQFKQGTSAGIMIKTLSQEHVALLQKHIMENLSKGKGYGWSADRLMKDMYPNGVDDGIRKSMKYKAERIIRTSYRNAVNDDMMTFLGDNDEVFYGARRTADGRPCLACAIRDGEFIPIGTQGVLDHPNGMCVAVPLTYPPEYFNTGKITKWPENDIMGKSLHEKFYSMAIAEQKAMLGRSTFNLWQKEKFDLRQVISYKTSTPLPYYRVLANLEKNGAISYSNVHFSSRIAKNKLNVKLDPWDRSVKSKDMVILKDAPVEVQSKLGIRKDGFGDDILKSSLSEKEKARLSAMYNLGDPANMHWSQFNEFAKDIGLWTRKSTIGDFYYVLKTSEVAKYGISYGKLVDGKWVKAYISSGEKKIVKAVPKKKAIERKVFITPSDEFKKVYQSSGKVAGEKIAQGNVNAVVVETLDDGTKVIKKIAVDKNEILMEQGYYNISKSLGMDIVPETTVIGNTSIQKFVNGETHISILGKEKITQGKLSNLRNEFQNFILKTKEGSDYVLIDTLMRAADRHPGNLMYTYKKGRISNFKLIDNGRCLSAEGFDRWVLSDTMFGQSGYSMQVFSKKSIFKLHSKTKINLQSYLKDMGWDKGVKKGTVAYEKMWKNVQNNITKSLGESVSKTSTTYATTESLKYTTQTLRTIVEDNWTMNLRKLGWRID